ncbi:uncharacterized protein BP5553_04546 [Venustampulla echinocandica]|uniref:Uncharacterized protein n=1 Tax=Venustampulla echinocandica TaxID=2656787 RepID=A0A370TNL0_9HELO|nr:uncharacterized protein BP5553_04546 [Venustampulla echinocandica]RDL37113.1 hypothetical protein BP5553_04546 [Venustampulla echinocandica]
MRLSRRDTICFLFHKSSAVTTFLLLSYVVVACEGGEDRRLPQPTLRLALEPRRQRPRSELKILQALRNSGTQGLLHHPCPIPTTRQTPQLLTCDGGFMRHIIPQIRICTRAVKKPPVTTYRAIHTATAKFITISPQGAPATREVEVYLGDPEEAFVLLDPEICQAFKRGTMLQGGCSMAHDQYLYPLKFHHDTRHFSHESSLYPRLEIPQDLPRQSDTNSSPATLHTYGATHAITLDGTPDEAFERSLRESAQRLQPILDELKDTESIPKDMSTNF